MVDQKENPEQTESNEEVQPEVKMVPKKVTCPRCLGDGIWHTTKTGRRALTTTEPTVDAARVCPKCKGKKKVTIMITKEQADAEAVAKAARTKANRIAGQARAAADKADKAAKAAEAILTDG